MQTVQMLADIKPRLYQEAIFAQAAQVNTLVVLPTGLGKTLIAIMLAAQRRMLYPQSKVLILAPTKPLVQQHEQTFKRHMNVAVNNFATFTGETGPEKRKALWKEANIIFSTPQALENDLLTRSITLDDVSLLVVDEAHRASGDYAYVFVAKQYMTYSKTPRILALTASPGSQKEAIDEVIKNLFIEHVEVRNPDDPDVKEYLQEVNIEYVTTPLPPGFIKVKNTINAAFNARLAFLKQLGYANADSKGALLALQSQLHGQMSSGEKDFNIYKAISVAAEALKLSHAL
jgi:ERCC4-related helicase